MTWQISGAYLGAPVLSTVSVTTLPGPFDASKSIFTCIENVPAMSEGVCTIQGRDTHNNIVMATEEYSTIFCWINKEA